MAQNRYDVQVGALQVAPVLATEWPDHTQTLPVMIKAFISCILAINKTLWIIEFQKGMTLAELVSCIILIIANVNAVILKDLRFIYKIRKPAVQHVLCKSDRMDKLRLLKF